MFKKFFGGKEEDIVSVPVVESKKFNQMNKEEIKDMQKGLKKKLA